MIGNFLQDDREYVTKRQRIDAVARCLEQQCILLSDLVDSCHDEGEEDNTDRCRSLSQTFPFPNCPPTIGYLAQQSGSQSPSLEFLISAVHEVYETLGASDQLALQSVVRNISGAVDAAFSCWSVGVGIEDQLNILRESCGLLPLPSLAAKRQGLYLDYKGMVRPEVILETFKSETYRHNEDFFFRSVHLATECWTFIALDRLNHAYKLSLEGQWHRAAGFVHHAAVIIEYVGSNIMTLRCMNLRDYLSLKVEIEGTSGEGSSQVKKLKPAARRLLRPLIHAAKVASQRDGSDGREVCVDDEDESAVAHVMMRIYLQPEIFPGAFPALLECLAALGSQRDPTLCGIFMLQGCMTIRKPSSISKMPY